eukprot:CAMPEP_0197641210 /NCGR_PEP_ID=MMETSP1338-20131121/15239_1 /TAXON_ID=43686 ORGANISM="Pelagodinium beii, Strain RCC1491" /NCGR_SAMPLE_ID=MMETSP1338 /ASSEMBLY_ACC=CAM_ASM_000754 /LENGTH=778 /DNA_ID=CAMNT_0043214151 /DNA_START=39 /DNA_END=2375 /DNA_ORIENTATION=-
MAQADAHRPHVASAATLLAGSGFLLSSSSRSFAAPAWKSPVPELGQATAKPSQATSSRRSSKTATAAASTVAGSLLLGQRLRKQQRKACRKVKLAALPPESAEFLSFAQDFLHQHSHSVDQLGAVLHHWADALASGAADAGHALLPPAFAEDVAAATSAAPKLPEGVELDPNVKYLFGADGVVLLDPMNNKPITDDWWNGFIGFQSDIIKAMDLKLRELGVEQAFGWSIVAYTTLVKVLFFPLQQGQLKSTTMMQMLSPKTKEIQERYKDDPETQQRLLGQLYSVMDVNPLGGCLPLFLQIPIFWSLYGVWRRLASEKFEHYSEGWLWVPSLSQPNPDFQFKFDWLFQFKDGQPEMGWHDYLCYLIFPVILVGFTIIQQEQAKASRPKDSSQPEEMQVVMQVLPWISVYFIGSLALELPQAVSVYYTCNSLLTVAQTQAVKLGLREEIPGYVEFEKTGKFPDDAFESMARSQAPAPVSLHEAAMRGDVAKMEPYLTEEGVDINAWDDKKIAPIGYAVACGHVEAVKWCLEKGADLKILDGSGNNLMHYAAGYGHIEVLKELMAASKDSWPKDEWATMKNGKGQTPVDAARVNRKGAVVDYLCEELGLDAEVVKLPAVPAPAAPATPSTGSSGPPASTATPQSPEAAQARAALLAAAGGQAQAPAGQPAGADTQKATEAMRKAMEKLRSNPEAMKQAQEMMGKMPPQMLSALSGGKISSEDAQKAVKAMTEMSPEDLLQKGELATDEMERMSATSKEKETVPPAPAPATSGSKPARSVD